MTKRILLIGGNGFIGSRLWPILIDSGHRVSILDKKPNTITDKRVRYWEADIRDHMALRAVMPKTDLVINLAAEHRDDVRPASLYTDVNVTGARILCEAAMETEVKRIIFTSSVAVYGTHRGPMTETTSHNFFNEYGRTKHLAEKEYEKWLEASHTHQLTIVRPTVVFGPGNRGNVYNFLRQMKYGPFVMFGDGANIKSMAHVDNISSFLAFLALKQERQAVYNYADKPDFTVRALVSFVDQALGRANKRRLALPRSIGLIAGRLADTASWVIRRPLPISEVRVQKFCAPSEIDARRAFATGFTPPTKLEDGLARMVRDHV